MFTHRYSPEIGGVELSVERTSEALCRRGHRVTVITESCATAGEDPGIRADARDSHCPRVHRMTVIPVWPVTRLRYWRTMGEIRDLWRNADVLHFHDYGPLIHWFLPWRTVSRSAIHAITFHGFDGWPIDRTHHVLRSVAARCVDVRFAVGSYIERYYEHPVDHVFLGAPVRHVDGAGSGDPATFLFIGRIAPDTGIIEALAAIDAAVVETGIAGRVILVGADDPSIRHTIAAICPHVRVDIHPPAIDIDTFIRDAGCVIATGFLATMDAFAAGVPVLFPALTAIKRDYIASIPAIDSMARVARSVEEMRMHAGELLRRTRDMFDPRRQRAREWVKSCTWDAIAAQHEDAYHAARHA